MRKGRRKTALTVAGSKGEESPTLIQKGFSCVFWGEGIALSVLAEAREHAALAAATAWLFTYLPSKNLPSEENAAWREVCRFFCFG